MYREGLFSGSGQVMVDDNDDNGSQKSRTDRMSSLVFGHESSQKKPFRERTSDFVFLNYKIIVLVEETNLLTPPFFLGIVKKREGKKK